MHPQLVCYGRINVKCLPGCTYLVLLWGILERAHVMQPVNYFDDDDTDVLCGCKYDLPEVFSLLLLGCVEVNLIYLGNALHKGKHFLAEYPCNVLSLDIRVLKHVMQQSCDNALGVQAQLGKNKSNLKNVAEIRLSREPLLAVMGSPCK